MLKVQTYLKSYLKYYSPQEALNKLTSKYAIKVTTNDYDNRVLLNYSQIDSPKTAEITRECRGLCLDKNDFSLISRGFRRFFNLGEWRADDNKFDWENCISQSKEDGSLLNVFYHNNEWKVCTRGSFGDIPYYDGGPTPQELFDSVIDNSTVYMDRRKTHIFELCSRHNKIVRDYVEPQLYLLTMFDKEKELDFDYVESERLAINGRIGKIKSPERFNFKSAKEVEDFIRERSKTDKTFEGIVVRDINNVRLKIKNSDYLCLHRLKGENSNLFMPKNLLPFILSGDTDELYTYFSEVKPQAEQMKKILDSEFSRCLSVWNAVKCSATRKEFALAIPKDLKTKSLLFTALDTGRPLKDLWSESADLLLKVLFS